MIRIMVYTVLDGTVCTIETDHQHPDRHWPTSEHWQSLAYVNGGQIAHEEDERLLELVKAALDAGHRRASERGGWSALI